ncbi:conjugal transfer protein TrbE [Ventosimonas gracilis]|uniref:Type IV secretion system protein virB4 n=1 Tax=Ventosimonas gracilis TaxID=1680762 RepID=A0A139SR27_9GAMM|nr:conjugal transfer protein TrbE [Ventosimonas gracilis]
MLLGLMIGIAVLGALLCLLLFMRLRQVDAHLKLNKHRSKQAGLADLLNYASVVDDGVIVGKNGALMAAFLYSGEDNESATEIQRENVSARINQALHGLGDGWMLHVDAVRRPAQSYSQAERSSFSDPICAAIDEERRRLFESLGTMYEGYFVLTLTYFPPVLAQRKFVEMMFDDNAKPADKTAQTMAIIEQFKRDIQTIENGLSDVLNLSRLGAHQLITEEGRQVAYDDFLSWLQRCISGHSQPVRLPDNPMYLDALIGGQEFIGGVIPKIGRKFISVVAIEGFPLQSTPGMLSLLAELAVEYRWSSRFIFMDEHQALAHLEKFQKKWKQKVRGFMDQLFKKYDGEINQDANEMVLDANEAIAEINSGLVAAGYYTSVVVLMHENRQALENASRQVRSAINRLGFASRIETINTMDAFFGSLPGHGVENVRRPLINTLNLADLLPTSSIWTGSEDAPCPLYPPLAPALMHGVTSGYTPFRLNLHVRDLGHTLMFGPTGAGKSTHLAILAAQFRRYQGMSLYAFDKGMSMYPLAAAINATTEGKSGLHFSVASDDDALAFCPLQYLDSKEDRAWTMQWLDTLLALNDVKTTPSQRNLINEALVSMQGSGAKTLSEFSVTIQDEQIREALKQYTVDGSMGHLLDAEQDGLSLSDFTVFEIEELMNLGQKYAMPVLLYLFRRIECDLKGQPAVIILDEAWLMLGHPVFREKIREWLKVLRKANCLVLLATQSLTDAVRSGILDVLVESTASKIFLPNVYAREDETAAIYRSMGLNDRQIEIIASAVPKRQYYYLSENGRRLYDLALGDLALAFVGASDKDSVAAIKQLQKQWGHEWVEHWLSARGLSLDDYIDRRALPKTNSPIIEMNPLLETAE